MYDDDEYDNDETDDDDPFIFPMAGNPFMPNCVVRGNGDDDDDETPTTTTTTTTMMTHSHHDDDNDAHGDDPRMTNTTMHKMRPTCDTETRSVGDPKGQTLSLRIRPHRRSQNKNGRSRLGEHGRQEGM